MIEIRKTQSNLTVSLLVTLEGRCIGGADMTRMPRVEGIEDCWWLARMNLKEQRRQGIGTRMMTALKHSAKKRPIVVSPGGYDMPKEEQLAFYQACGFKEAQAGLLMLNTNTKVTVDEMRLHVEQLCMDNGVEVDWRESTSPRAWRKSKKMRVKYIKSAITYSDALHELGHVLGTQKGPRIDKEVQAWEWAKANALVWNKRMKANASKCLKSYVKWSFRHKTAVMPKKSHPIYKWIKEPKR